MNSKYCPQCNCTTEAIRFGVTSSGRQRYRCKSCGSTWTNKPRSRRLEKLIWYDFVWNNIPVRALANKYHKHGNTIRCILHNYQPKPLDLQKLSDMEKENITVIAMDTTYFGRFHGVVVAVDAIRGTLLYFREIFGSETNRDYEQCIDTILAAGIRPKACIIDGRQGVRYILEKRDILVQLCQFHMKLMAKKYLTNNPILEPNIELKIIVDSLCHKHISMNEKKFYSMFINWHARHKSWLPERTYNEETHRREYSHQDTRSAFIAIKNHLDILFTYEHYPELNIPRTSNRIEGAFGTAKNKLRIHHGYTKQLKNKIFFSLLSGE